MTTETDALPTQVKAQVLAEALPWLKQLHGKIVVIKYGGNAMTDDAPAASVRRRHGVPAQLRRPSGGGARRRPADHRHAAPPRHRRGRLQGRIPGHHTGSARRGADGAVRPGGPRTGQPDQRARPLRRGYHRRGRAAVHRGAAQRHRRWRGHRHRPGRRRRQVNTAAVLDLIAARPYSGGLHARAGCRRCGAQHQRRYRRGGVGRSPGSRETVDAHRCRRPVHQLARPGFVGQRNRHGHTGATAAHARGGHDPEGRGMPAGRRRPACPAPTSSTAESSTACWWSCSPTRAPAPRWCNHEQHRRDAAALGNRDDEQLRHPAGRAGQR